MTELSRKDKGMEGMFSYSLLLDTYWILTVEQTPYQCQGKQQRTKQRTCILVLIVQKER